MDGKAIARIIDSELASRGISKIYGVESDCFLPLFFAFSNFLSHLKK